MRAIKNVLIVFLFLLGVAELIWPIIAATRRYSFDPKFARAFNFSQFTAEQMQVYRQFRVSVAQDWNAVSFFGIATILIAIVLWVANNKSKSNA
jgi:hypothetical protein